MVAALKDADRAGEHRGEDVRGSGPVEAIDHQAVPNALSAFGTSRISLYAEHGKVVSVVWTLGVTPWRPLMCPHLVQIESGAHQFSEFIGAQL